MPEESTSITPVTPGAVQTAPGDIMEMMYRAVVAGAPVEVMRGFFELRKDMEAERARVAYAQAMTRLQSKLPRITKTGRILNKNGTVRSTYAPLDDIDLEIRPLLIEEGFSISYSTNWATGVWTITCTILHQLGHREQSIYAVPMEKSDYRSGQQDTGAANMYAKRLCLCNALNIVTVDVDNDAQTDAQRAEAAKPLTLEQKNRLLDLQIASDADMDAFLDYMNVDSIDKITNGEFPRAKAALEAKLRAKSRS